MKTMTEDLSGKRILVVEDEYLLAQEIVSDLRRRGATIIGPVATMEAASALAGETKHLDGAILDINLKGEMIYPVADALTRRHVPYVFATGYDRSALPKPYDEVPLVQKPVDTDRLTALLFSSGRQL
jgi:CheY-like chemotaxis protein